MITVVMSCRFRKFSRNDVAGLTQKILGSGMKKLARIHVTTLPKILVRVFCTSSVGFADCRPPSSRDKVKNILYGSQIGKWMTFASGGTSASRDSSRKSKAGFDGVRTKGFHPKPGKYFTNLSHR